MEPSIQPGQGAERRTARRSSPSSSSGLASSIVCGGCGSVIDASEPYPFRCPRSGDGGDHVLRRVLDVSRLTFPLDASEPNPFVRWRGLFHAYHLGTAHGMSDEAFVELVRDLDSEVARVDGHGFVVTPFTAAPVLADRLAVHPSQNQPAWVGAVVRILRYSLSVSHDLLYVVSSNRALKHPLDCMAAEN